MSDKNRLDNAMAKQDDQTKLIFTPTFNAAEEENLITAELRPRINEQHLIALFAVMKYSSPGGLLLAWLTYAALYNSLDRTILLAWSLAISGFAVFRFYCSHLFERQRSREKIDVRRWIRYTFFLILTQGIAWASLPLAINAATPPNASAFIVYLLCALSFGSFTTLGFYLPIYAASAVPLFVATGYLFFYLAPNDFIPVIALIFLGSVSMLNSARNTQAMWRRTLRLVYEEEALAAQLGEEKERALTTLKSIGDAVITADLAGRVIFLNPSAETLTGWTTEAARGMSLERVLLLIDESTRRPISDLTHPDPTQPKILKQNVILLDKFDRDVAFVEVVLSPVIVPPNRATGFVVAIHDVTELRQIAKDMSHQAAHDPLTGLLNRRAFELQLGHIVASIQHDVSKTHALCFLDLDNFKAVNDACGHSAGDQLLKQIADILRKQVRELDAVSRIGGDEFAIILRGCDLPKAQRIAEEVCAKVKALRFSCNDSEFIVGVSVGITDIKPDDSVSAIIEAADRACYASKKDGRGIVRLADRPFKSSH